MVKKEDLIKEILESCVPDWIYDLNPGDKILHWPYQGSWTPPGTRQWYVVKFICVSGKKIWYQSPRHLDTGAEFSYELWSDRVAPFSNFDSFEEYLWKKREEFIDCMEDWNLSEEERKRYEDIQNKDNKV